MLASPDRDPTRVLVEFCAALRDEGLDVGTGDALTFASAIAELDPAKLEDVYWAGRITLTRGLAQIALYDEVFGRFFLGAVDTDDLETRKAMTAVRGRESVVTVPSGEDIDDTEHQPSRLGAAAAAVMVNRTKAFPDCTEEELTQIRRIIKSLRVAPPLRATRRRQGAPKGRRLDLRRMARKTIQNHGDPGDLAWLKRRSRQRPLVLILDISGSMADYSRNLLQFAYSTKRGAGRVEVFCFGTRLTRITSSLRHRDVDEALARAGEEVLDWAGGTQIGASLDTFVRAYARRGMARGAIVVICSDGLDRGDPAVLDDALDRLGRLSHRIVWMNPLERSADSRAWQSLGMSVAIPHIDLVWSGHNLASLEAFAEQLPRIR